MAEQKSLFRLPSGPRFDNRFLDQYAYKIINDPLVALLELVANAWDAYAMEVKVRWPSPEDPVFSITDDGHGMTAAQIDQRWMVLAYQRHLSQGEYAELPPAEDLPRRRAFGRNGKGRFGAFAFGSTYELATTRDGTHTSALIERRREGDRPFDATILGQTPAEGHGTTIFVANADVPRPTPAMIRMELGLRFLTNPQFRVYVNDVAVEFEDVPASSKTEFILNTPDIEPRPVLLILESGQFDRTARQHGIAWHVEGRQVGECNWGWFAKDGLRFDGRSSEAHRFTVIVKADALLSAVTDDWTGFETTNPAWQTVREAAYQQLESWHRQVTDGDRRERRDRAIAANRQHLAGMGRVAKDRWYAFLDEVVTQCPSLDDKELVQLSVILAKLETSDRKYQLLHLLGQEDRDGLDAVAHILDQWDAKSACIVLDELQERLTLIDELDRVLKDPQADEVHDVQPLFERALWVFGPEFETVEFIANKEVTTVIRDLLKGNVHDRCRLRPDIVVLPDLSASLSAYAQDAYDADGNGDGLANLVIIELKAPIVVIGEDEKTQAYKYVKEMARRGVIRSDRTRVTCFVMGRRIDPGEAMPREEWEGRCVIRPLSFSSFLARAHSRTFRLYEKIRRIRPVHTGPLFASSDQTPPEPITLSPSFADPSTGVGP
jgi:hypothetical protein